MEEKEILEKLQTDFLKGYSREKVERKHFPFEGLKKCSNECCNSLEIGCCVLGCIICLPCIGLYCCIESCVNKRNEALEDERIKPPRQMWYDIRK